MKKTDRAVERPYESPVAEIIELEPFGGILSPTGTGTDDIVDDGEEDW